MPRRSTSSFTWLKGLLLLLSSLFIITFCHGQSIAMIDSMYAKLKTMPEDSQKVKAYFEINKICLRQFELDRLETYLEELKPICNRLNHVTGISHYYNYSGLVSYHRGNYPDALTKFNTAFDIREKAKDQKGMADNLSNIGMVHDQLGNYPKAIEYYKRALSLRSETDTRGKSAAYTNLGIIYFKLGDYPAALTNYLESLHMDELAGDKQDIAYSNNNLGLFYNYQGNIPQALHYYKIANELCKEIGDRECIAGTNLNIGSLHQTLGEHQEALQYYEGSLKIFEDIGMTQEILNTQGNIGNIHRALKDYESALKYQKAALATATQMNQLPGIAKSSSNLGEIYTELGQYEEAQKYFDQALSIYKESGEIIQLRNNYYNLFRLDSLRGDYSSALRHFKTYSFYKDSLVNESSLKAIAEIQTKFETDKKDKEIRMLENEKEIQGLQLSLHEKTLQEKQAEENKLRVENLMYLQKADIMDKERQLHVLELENSKTREIIHQSELLNQETSLSLLKNAAEMQQLEIRKQRAMKNFLLAGLILSALLAFFAYHYYVTRQKLKLQTLRNKIASDLHDDVGSTLSSISIFSEIAQQQSKEVIPLLNTIKESSHKMLDAMGDIVWTINPENDQFEKILIRMRNFAFALLGARKIDFEFTADEEVSRIQLPMEARKNLYLIFKEAANNMVKYSEADKAHFSIRKEMGFLTLLIRDNGKGFDLRNEERGNGIKSMKKRAEDIGAKLHIESSPGVGTVIELRMAV